MICKEKTKQWHDKRIFPREFVPSQKVFLYNSKTESISWQMEVKVVWPLYSQSSLSPWSIEVKQDDKVFKVNGQWLKHYLKDDCDRHKVIVTLADHDKD